MAKVAVLAKITAQPGKRDEVLAVVAEKALPAADGEPGTEVYAWHADRADDTTIWVYELYADQAALDAHGSGPVLGVLGEALKGLLAARPEVLILDPAAAKGLVL